MSKPPFRPRLSLLRLLLATAAIPLLLAGCSTKPQTPPKTFGVSGPIQVSVEGIPHPQRIEAMQFLTDGLGFVAVQKMPWSSLQGGTVPAPGGTLRVTRDGGRSWAELRMPPIIVDGLDFLSADHGFVYGKTPASADLFATSDGGRTWSLRLNVPLDTGRPYSQTLDTLHFWDAFGGYALLDGHAFISQDGGATWQPIPLPRGAEDVAFFDADIGLAVTRSQLYATSDRGGHWHVAWTLPAPLVKPIPSYLTPAELDTAFALTPEDLLGSASISLLEPTRSGAFAVFTEGCAGEGTTCASYVVRSSEDGKVGVAAPTAAPSPLTTPSAVTASGENLLTSYGATPDGSHWTAYAPLQLGVADLSSPAPGSIWLEGTNGWMLEPLIHSSDGGRSWHAVHEPLFPTMGIQFISRREAFGFGMDLAGNPTILWTKDGGKRWSLRAVLKRPRRGRFFQVRNFWFAGPRIGYVVATYTKDFGKPSEAMLSELLRTQDGGMHWTAVHDADNRWGDYLKGLGPNWLVVTDGNGLMVTRDGGRTWQPAGVLPWPFGAVYIAKTGSSWAVDGRHVLLYRSADHGRTWRFAGPLDHSPFAIGFSDPKHGWMAISWGHLSLLRTSDGGVRWTQYHFPDPWAFGSMYMPQRVFSFSSPSHGYLDMYFGLFRTTDGGRHWTRITPR